jgi:transcription factor IIIB 90 kDa subunit
LQVNVFELGHTYLQLVQTLNLRLPLVDPSHYISRFAALLEFGDETHKVATDAIRLVQRFDRDWMTKGRRPAGICGACLLLAARMNNFRRSVEEIVQVVKIADTTLRKRLDEFKNTPSGALTLTDFRTVWLEQEMDPPAFTKGKEKEKEAADVEVEGDEDAVGKKRKRRKGEKVKKKRRRLSGGDSNEDAEGESDVSHPPTAVPPPVRPRPVVDPTLLNQGILVGTSRSEPLFLLEDEDTLVEIEDNANIDPTLLRLPACASQPPSQRPLASTSSTMIEDLDQGGRNLAEESSEHPLEASVSAVLAEEVTTYLTNEQGTQLSEALAEAHERRQAQMEVADELVGLDEEELDRFILTEDEVKIKERVWVEMNREYLEAIARVYFLSAIAVC